MKGNAEKWVKKKEQLDIFANCSWIPANSYFSEEHKEKHEFVCFGSYCFSDEP